MTRGRGNVRGVRLIHWRPPPNSPFLSRGIHCQVAKERVRLGRRTDLGSLIHDQVLVLFAFCSLPYRPTFCAADPPADDARRSLPHYL